MNTHSLSLIHTLARTLYAYLYTHTHTHALSLSLQHTQVVWLQGVSDEAKLELACALIEQGMDVNSQSIERATKATSGTFVLTGIIYTATHCNTLQHAATHCNTLQHTASGTFVLTGIIYIYYMSIFV